MVDTYAQKFPGLDSLIPQAADFVRTVQAMRNEMVSVGRVFFLSFFSFLSFLVPFFLFFFFQEPSHVGAKLESLGTQAAKMCMA